MIRNVSMDAPSSLISSKKIKRNKTNKTKKKRLPVFPQRLYEMLEDANQEGYSHLIGWSPDGRSFRISYDATNNHNHSNNTSFVDEVLTRKFNQTQFKSFLRQLQLYGFERQFKGKRKGECKHPLLQRGHPHLLQNKSIEDFQDATHTALANRISISNNTIIRPQSLLILEPSVQLSVRPSVRPSLSSVAIRQQKQHAVLSSSAKEEEKIPFPFLSSSLSLSSLPFNHRLVPHYPTRTSTSALTSTKFDTTDSYCTDGASSSSSKYNYPTKLTNLVLSDNDVNNQDNNDNYNHDDDDDDDDDTTESNSGENSLSRSTCSNKVFTRPFFNTNNDEDADDGYHGDSYDNDNDTFCDDDVDMRDENMMTSVNNDNDNANDVQQQQQQQQQL